MTTARPVLFAALCAILAINIAAAAGTEDVDSVVDRALRQKRQGYGRPFGVPGGVGPREVVVVEEVINRGGPPAPPPYNGGYYNGDYYNGGYYNGGYPGGYNYYNGGGWQGRGGFNRPGWGWRQPSTTFIEKEIIRTPGK